MTDQTERDLPAEMSALLSGHKQLAARIVVLEEAFVRLAHHLVKSDAEAAEITEMFVKDLGSRVGLFIQTLAGHPTAEADSAALLLAYQQLADRLRGSPADPAPAVRLS